MLPSSLFALFFLISCLLAPAAEPAKETRLDPDLPYQAKRSNPVTYDVDYSAVVTPPYHTKVLRVWLPIPPSNAGQEVGDSDLSTFPMEVKPRIETEPLYGNRFAYFEFDHPEGAQIIRHRFKVKVWELRWDVDPAKVVAVERWPEGFQRYLRSEDQAVVINDALKQVTGKVVADRGNAARDLSSVMKWVNDTLTYDHVDASLQASALHAL